MSPKTPILLTVPSSLVLVALACSAACSDHAARGSGGQGPKSGVIAIDGSSTVFPVSEAMAEEFQKREDARVTIGVSGTGGGFKKFCGGETDITGASRPIRPSEVQLCEQRGVRYIELPVAQDGIAVVVNRRNTWVDHLTLDELHRLWSPQGAERVRKWSDLREGWPERELHLFGPGVDSGTYDYFTKAIVGTEHESRADFTSSEDDNVLVQGVSTDKWALGFFGFAYYAENQDRLKLVPVDDGQPDNGDGPVAPSPTTIRRGTYQPLARPIFIYVSLAAAKRPEVQALVHFYLGEGTPLVREVGYVQLPAPVYEAARERFDQRVTGSVFSGGGSQVGVAISSLLNQG